MRGIIKYPGSKWRISDWILSYFPKHHSYLEPFFGSGAVFFSKQRSNIETINDLDEDVVNLFHWVQHDPERLAHEIYYTPYSRQIYDNAFLPDDENSLDKAVKFLIRLNMGYGYRTTGAKVGWKNDVQGREKAYAALDWKSLPDRILEITERLRGVQIENRQAVDVISRFNYENVLIYCDPPYLLDTRSGGEQYKREMTEDDHENLLYQLKKHKGFVLLSGYESKMYDPIIYETIGMNRNSIGYWFPTLKKASEKQNFFQIPATKIVKVPLTLLQLTRCDYMGLTPTTIDIVNRWAYEAFELDENKTYFIKTGTYSSKFDFRNAKVTTSKEVRELGSYLLFIHFQALQMASPLSSPCIYGVSTTNEWCVREYIEDKENNPCIYHGMPLHTEYRVFIDCDSDEVLGITPYWRSDVMKKRFTAGSDADTADMKHDYIIYQMHERKLMSRYNKNKELIVNKVNEMIPNINLTGQWSLDIMQNGDDFWLIDMATADCSALNDCIPKEKLNKVPENWIPDFERLKSN